MVAPSPFHLHSDKKGSYEGNVFLWLVCVLASLKEEVSRGCSSPFPFSTA